MQLYAIYDATELSQRKVYQVDGILYRYIYPVPSTASCGYLFRPLPGQSKKADLKLSRNKLSQKCKEVVGMSTGIEVIGNALQLSLL